MTFSDLLARVSRSGVVLWVEGETLRIRAPRGAITPELRGALEEHKPTLIEWIRVRGSADPDAGGGARAVLPDPTRPLPRPTFEAITETFARRVRERPGDPAISQSPDQGSTGEPRVWTYRELDRASRLVAGRLRGRGIQPGQVVGVRGEQSFALIAHLVGVMRTGAVILPIDPDLPPARQRLMLDRAAAALLLDTDSPAAEQEEPSAVRLGEPWIDPEEDATAECSPALTGGAPAYVFFTSGTTGAPKGILGSHDGLAHFLDWQRTTFATGPGDRCAQLTGLSFDVVLRSIFLPLTSGGVLCLPRPHEKDPAAVWPWMADRGVTLVHTVPALTRRWLAAFAPGGPAPALRCAFFAGEPLSDELVRRWRGVVGTSCEVVNLYGPTETTLAKCFYRVPLDLAPGVQPVGASLPSSQALVLNQRGQLCGIGESGEIYIRTPYRSLGYIGARDEEVARFVPNPFRDDAADLLYRTGDRGCYRDDGSLQFLGRVDDQVKIHGVRVEPAEVNAALEAHPGLTACFTAVRAGRDGEPSLVAYYVAKEAARPSPSELRAHLAAVLPAAMVPAAFIPLDELPHTANGKVNRAALPALDEARFGPQERSASRALPRTATETVVRDIWREVLRVDLVGVHDSFFDVGGHSLLATQVMARVRQRTGVSLPLRALFEAPTIALLAARIDGARGGAHPSTDPAPPIQPIRRGGELRLSFAQERLWFLHQLEPDAPAHNLASAVRVRGAVDAEVMAGSLRDMADRHEMLRTTFGARGGLPFQRVEPTMHIPLERSEVAGDSLDERLAAAAECIRRAARRPFDLERGPLLRGQLIRLGDDDHVFALHMHHIVSDGWSLGILAEEVSAAYQARGTGSVNEAAPPLSASLPRLPIQYVDYAAWQGDRWSDGDLPSQVDHFVARLADVPAVLDLPTDRRRPPVQSFQGGTEEIWFDAELVVRLGRLSTRCGSTPAMSLLALFGLLLHRYSGQSEFAVGMPIANRQHLELEPLVGLFANTIVVRMDLTGNPPLAALVARVRDEMLAAYAHQDAPFEKVVERLRPERDLSRNPVFQVMFAYQNMPPRVVAGEMATEPLELPRHAAEFDLELRVEEHGDRLRVLLDYATDLFDASTAARLLRCYRTLTQAAADGAETAAEGLPLLDPEERRLAVGTWKEARRDYPHERTFAALLAAQASRRPDAIAAADGAAELTYGELAARAEQVAAALAREGASIDSLVPIIGPRDVSLLTAIAGVLRAGAAYVPVDPSYPPARIRRILTAAQPRQLICSASARSAVEQALHGATGSVRIHDLQEIVASRGAAPPPVPDEPSALVYVIFTSGSTGQPKGVMIHSRGMVNHIFTKIDDLRLRSDDITIQNASHCFDISVWQFLAPLVVGGVVRIVPDEIALSPILLADAVRTSGATVLEVVPSVLRELVALDHVREACASLRWLLATGEALPPELCDQWLARVPDVGLINAYGPTECSDDTHHYRVPEGGAGSTVPIGRPVGNMFACVLEPSLEPCPSGAVGELVVGGVGVGRGYLGDPARTAERFVPDALSGEPGERLYRTGDLAVQRPDGVFQFRGRGDDQVKLRGFRIELGEVESALARIPGVRAAAVATRLDPAGHARLAAYIVPDHASHYDEEAVRAAAAVELPDYMVPSVFMRLDAFPLTINGKLDRKALPPIDLSALATGPVVPPRTETEAQLAAIWREVLGLDGVGVTDDFFRIGGHSLSVSQVAARLRATFGVELPLRTLFECRTIETLAAAVEVAEIQAADASDLACLADELADLSDEEARQLLAADST